MAKYIKTEAGYKTAEELEGVATQDAVDEAYSLAEQANSVANTAQATANQKMNASNPIGIGNFSIGNNNIIDGVCCQAEGQETTAVGNGQHVQGRYNIPEPRYKLVQYNEGSSILYLKNYVKIIVAKDYSLDQKTGYITLIDPQCFINNSSGAEAALKTNLYPWFTLNKTLSDSITTIRAYYNITPDGYVQSTRYDSNYISNEQLTYAHIVGNGTSNAERSNAHTLDWEGNAWYAGDIYVGSASGTNKDEGSKKLATEEYVDASLTDKITTPATATVGQTIAVKSVNEFGKPTEWEAVDMASGVDTTEVEAIVETSLAEAKASGEFDGADGKDGTSITVQSVTESSEDGGENKVVFSDGKSITVKNGKTGKQGIPGKDGTGVTILGSYATEAELNSAHPTGNAGEAYMVDGNLYVWSATTNAWENVGNIKGEAGADGYSPTVAVSKRDNVTTIAITDKYGKKTATINDGAPGKDGANGKDGVDGKSGNGIKSIKIIEV